MAANSKNIFDIYEWIKKVIDSCETPHHFISAKKLIGLYNKELNNKYDGLLCYKLRDYLDLKQKYSKNGEEIS